MSVINSTGTSAAKFEVGLGVCYINNSLHLARKYARIFVRGHYLFREANSFQRAKLEENCELRGTDNVQGQNIWTYFRSQIEAIVLIIQFLLGNIHPREAFRPIAHQRKYLMDYNNWYVFDKLKACHFVNFAGFRSFHLKINKHFILFSLLECVVSQKQPGRGREIVCWHSTLLFFHNFQTVNIITHNQLLCFRVKFSLLKGNEADVSNFHVHNVMIINSHLINFYVIWFGW